MLIRAIFKGARATYGAPRVHAELQAMGEKVGLNRVARLMAEDGLEGRSPRRRPRGLTKPEPGVVGENLLDRQSSPEAPNRAWVADTTFLKKEEGSAFLVAVLDLYSRRVVGWSLAGTFRHELGARGPQKGPRAPSAPPGGFFHSDRGGGFTSHAFTEDPRQPPRGRA